MWWAQLLNVIAGIHGTGVAAATNSYESIATVTVGSGGSSTITFSSIPSTYKHLQIRGIARATGNTAEWIAVNLNGTGSVYRHVLFGNGSSAGSSSAAESRFLVAVVQSGAPSNMFGGFVIDVLDYADTNKNKTIRGLGGKEMNGHATSYVTFGSSLYNSTTAVSSLTITPDADSFAQYSQFALYGIKG